jgi:hypothetical protein
MSMRFADEAMWGVRVKGWPLREISGPRYHPNIPCLFSIDLSVLVGPFETVRVEVQGADHGDLRDRVDADGKMLCHGLRCDTERVTSG